MTKVRQVAAVLGVLALLAIAGCGGDDSGPAVEDGSPTSTGKQTVERTKVEVVTGLGKKGFDPATIYERLSPGVVTVTSLFDGERSSASGAGQGSGFVIDGSGHVATNAHVITEGSGTSIERAKDVFVEFADGNQVPAKIIGFDPNADVGLIKVDPAGLRLVPLQLGRASEAEVGDPVVAIGSPFGEEGSLSVGVVSAKNRTIEALTNFSIGDAIQTDAAVNRGNSGGPLLNQRGQVIGINSQIRSSSGGSVGVGFAVPVETVKRSIDQIRATGKVRYAYIGISSQPLYPQLAKRLGVPVSEGATIAEVVEDGPADKAGLKGGDKEIRFQASQVKIGGDVITRIDGRKVTRENDFSDQILRYQPGDRIIVEVYRDGKRRRVQVTLAERPAQVPDR